MSKKPSTASRTPAPAGQPAQPGQNHLQLQTLQVSQFQGPLPPPQVLGEYEAMHPGAAKIIIDLAVSESNHRRLLERTAIEAEAATMDRASRDGTLGLWLGFLIGVAAIAGAVACIMTGHEWSGGTLGVSSLASLVGTFVYGSRQKRQEASRASAPPPATAQPPAQP